MIAVPPLVRRLLTESGLTEFPAELPRYIGRARRSLLALFERFGSAAQGRIRAVVLSSFHWPEVLCAGSCGVTLSRHRVGKW